MNNIGFLSNTNIQDVRSSVLQMALQTHPRCTLIEGDMQQLQDRLDELGIQTTRGSGHFFKDTSFFPSSFHYVQLNFQGKSYLWFGMGDSLDFSLSKKKRDEMLNHIKKFLLKIFDFRN